MAKELGRREFLKKATQTAAAVAVSGGVVMSATVSAERRPNVVVLMADDLGWGDIGCYDGPVRTPALDGLAAKGMRFTDFYSGCAVCSPSRAVLMTGRHHIRAGVYSWIFDQYQESHLLEREVTLAEVLKSQGYSTAHMGKWHLGLPTWNRKKPTPTDHGFDYWFATLNNAGPSHKDPDNLIRNGEPVGETEGYACQIVVDEAITWLERKRDPEKPFFLNVWFHEPHAPLAAPDEMVSQYGELNDEAAIYSATIDNTDRAIARLLTKLEKIDSPENTLIIYSSDNGSYRADRCGGLRGSKGSNYQGGIRVPGIISWPGTIPQGRVESEPGGLVDVLPTVCGLFGIEKPRGVHLDGSDLSPILTNRHQEFRRHQPMFWHLAQSYPAVGIRDGDYALVAARDYDLPRDEKKIRSKTDRYEELLRRNNGRQANETRRLRAEILSLTMFQEAWIPIVKSGNYKQYQLYDLVKDPKQEQDLAEQLPDVVARLKNKLLEINASVMADAPDWHLAADP